MYRRISLLFFLFAIPYFAAAQQNVDSVKKVVDQFFAAMRYTDTAQLRKLLTPNVIFQTVKPLPNGLYTASNESVEEFLKNISQLKKGQADERIEFATVNIDGALAAVWTPYQFYFNNQFSHCGVNSFTLIKSQDEWRINYIVDTRRRVNCSPAKQ